jgi:hypothetical protein
VPPFEVSVQLVLVGLDHGYIVSVDTELAATQMVAQPWRLHSVMAPLLLVPEHMVLMRAHLLIVDEVAFHCKDEQWKCGKMESGRLRRDERVK